MTPIRIEHVRKSYGAAVAVIVPATAAETRIMAARPIPMKVKIRLLNIVCSLGRCR